MGLKNKLSKMKSFLFDEEDEKEGKLSKKKEKQTISEKVEKPKEKEIEIDDNEIEELYFENTNVDLKKDDIIQSRVVKNEREFKFPDFNDDDFMVKKEEPKIKEIKSNEEVVKKVPLYQGSKRKEETKRFKPSPIISPVYGLLDEEGNTLKKDEDSSNIFKNNDEVSFDDVRKKAYGIIDESLSDTIENLSTKTIEQAEKEMEEKKQKLSRTDEKEKKVRTSKKVKEESEDDNDDMILPNIDFKEIDVDKKVSTKSSKKIVEEDDDEDEETKEQDLFKLIDTMYDKEGKGE